MKIEKRILSELEMVYSVSTNRLKGEMCFMAATEGHGKCLLFSPPDWKVSTIWEGPGGTMSLIPIQERNSSFLAIQGFFPIFQAENTSIVYVQPPEVVSNPWKVKKVIDLPFVHRIDIVKVDGSPFLVASTLCGGKEFKDDWSKPGTVYAGQIPEASNTGWSIIPILEGVSKNHGLHVKKLQGRQVILVSGAEGVFMLQVPVEPGAPWNHKCLIDHEVSDIYVSDIDDDGDDEIITIEPFHGNQIVIYKVIEGRWKPVRRESTNFGHVIWAGKILNESCIIGGGRAGEKELVLLYPQKDITLPMKHVIIDENVGPTSLVVVHKTNYDVICSANHGVGEVALYQLSH